MTERTCRVCGCTQNNACLTPAGPCHWVERDLCSGCASPGLLAFALSLYVAQGIIKLRPADSAPKSDDPTLEAPKVG